MRKLFYTKNPKDMGSFRVGSIAAIVRRGEDEEVIGFVYTDRQESGRRVHQGYNTWWCSSISLKEGYGIVDPSSKEEEDQVILQWAKKAPGMKNTLIAPMWGGEREKRSIFHRKNEFSVVEWVEFYLRPATLCEVVDLFTEAGEDPLVFQWGGEVPRTWDSLLNGEIQYSRRDGKSFLIKEGIKTVYCWMNGKWHHTNHQFLQGLSPVEKVDYIVNHPEYFNFEDSAPRGFRRKKEGRIDSELTLKKAEKFFLVEEEEEA